MKVRYAEPKDKSGLKEMWQKCFSDSEKFVKWNFENNFACENAMLLENDESMLSSLHLIPYDVVFRGTVLKGVYVSAVATMKQYRGKGCAANLIRSAISEMEKRGAEILFLVPAINGYYERFGFLKTAEKEKFILPLSKSLNLQKTIIPNAAEVLEIYLEANKNKTFYLKRSLKDTMLILSDITENTGGECIMLDDGSAYAMYKIEKDKVRVFEIMGRSAEAKEDIKKVLSSCDKPLACELPPLMVKPLKNNLRAEDFLLPRKDIYFNLIL